MDKTPKLGNRRKNLYRVLSGAFMGASVLCAVLAGRNAWNIHTFDKYVIKQIEIAANVPSASSSSPGELSMESSLKEAKKHLSVSPLENTSLVWKTPDTSVTVLDRLLSQAITRAHQIQQLKDGFETKQIRPEYPSWVKDAITKLDAKALAQKAQDTAFLPALEELTESEFGQRIANEYEALNTAIAGGTRISAKSLKEKHRSLLDTLDKARWMRAIIRLHADDYMYAYAQTLVGYLLANMGDISGGLEQMQLAKKRMEGYPPSQNLAILRDTPELAQSTINGLIDSSIKELRALEKDPARYSAGWWTRLKYFNQSIGGQENPSIMDLAEGINNGYYLRMYFAGAFTAIFFYLTGMFTKKFRLSKKYEVEPEQRQNGV